MGDMYDVMLGDGKQQTRGALFAKTILGFEQGDIPRFRDAWIELDHDGTLMIAVYTRVGGNNRADYMEQIGKVEAHPLYRRTDNDTYDTTYTTFRFSWPGSMPEHLKGIEGWQTMDDAKWMALAEATREQAEPKPVDMDEKWREAGRELELNGPTQRQAELMAPAMEKLKQALEGPPDPSGGPNIIYL